MYNRDRKVTTVLIIAFAAHIVSGLVIQLVAGINGISISDPGVVICAGKILPKWVYLVWIAPILFELTVLGLSLNKGIEYYRAVCPVTNMRLRASRRSLVYILLRDSITFPFLGLLAAVLNLLTWMSYSRYVPQFTFMILSFIPCILGCRLVLNLREAYYKPFLEEAGANDTHSFELGFSAEVQDDSRIGTEAGLANSGGLYQRYSLTQMNSRSGESLRIPREHDLEPPG
ncbi:unnamed protein product [Cyclocybe aegerita]|uniref:Uncharacterized protein n=1 Tax=Cyclocybe aegerita TaxID=1973307 RepID=A0A8S0WJC1_CYCAE|nr:unnamed protein product [Cyclocybe aegerita]